jgi:hypothetical protein
VCSFPQRTAEINKFCSTATEKASCSAFCIQWHVPTCARCRPRVEWPVMLRDVLKRGGQPDTTNFETCWQFYKKKSSGSGTGSTQPREYNWGATW